MSVFLNRHQHGLNDENALGEHLSTHVMTSAFVKEAVYGDINIYRLIFQRPLKPQK